jgi:hypothetical protein
MRHLIRLALALGLALVVGPAPAQQPTPRRATAMTRFCTSVTCWSAYRLSLRNACPSYFPTVGRPRGRPRFQRTRARPNNLDKPSSSGDRGNEPSYPQDGAEK